MRLLIYSTIALFLLLSCSPARKVRKAIDTLNANPEAAAKYCGDKFPPHDSTVTILDTVIRAENKDYSGAIDSLWALAETRAEKATADSLRAAQSHALCRQVVADQAAENARLRSSLSALRNSYKPCLPDTIKITTKIYQANTAKEKSLQYDLTKSQANYDTMIKNRDWWRKVAVILMALIGAYVLLRVFVSKLPTKL